MHAENISAANKIRLLLSSMKISYDIPESLPNLRNYIANLPKDTYESDTLDAPEIIVQIRNAIVHSHVKKRKRLSAVNAEVRSEILRLCVLYVELSLLNILHYKGKYFNRCERETRNTPW